MSTTKTLKNINLLTQAQYEKITPNENELYCVAGHFLIEVYNTENYWRRVYSDGWIEQGGKVTVTTTLDISYPLSFQSAPLKVTVDPYNQPTNSTSDNNYICMPRNITNTAFTLAYHDSDGSSGRTGLCTWEAKGF